MFSIDETDSTVLSSPSINSFSPVVITFFTPFKNSFSLILNLIFEVFISVFIILLTGVLTVSNPSLTSK
ncbi:MAG: hypothetical protein ACRCSD_01070 [Clostridium sp.]